MGRVIECRRHSIKDGTKSGTIGPKGFTLARAVGERQLRGRNFTHYFASRLWRTHQTLAAFGEGAGDFTLYLSPEQADFYLDWPELFDLWRACHRASKQDIDMMQAALHINPELANRAAFEGANRFLAWVATLPADANVLVVGHSPYMELVVRGLCGITIPGLKECQGFRVFVDESFRVDWQSPDLDPSVIRSGLFRDS